MGWESDCFVFAVESWQGLSTRRSLLSYVASVLDPLGLVAPCVLPSKLLTQDLTRIMSDWDEISRWKYCLRKLQSVQRLRINRCLSPAALEAIANLSYTPSTMHQNLTMAQLSTYGFLVEMEVSNVLS